MPTVSHIKEDELIQLLTDNITTFPEVLVGIGDDCAVIEKTEYEHTLLKTDTVVENIHFTPEEDPERVGWKAAARVVSDFASMGGKPEALMVTIILPPDTKQEWILKAYNGLKTVARKFGCSIVGGETSSTTIGAPKIISVSASGVVGSHNLTLRSGAKPNDLIYVTGRLGGSIRGKHLDFTPRVKEGLWLARHIKPTAMMDLSDGIAKDLPRLCKSSRCGFEIFKSKIPLSYNCTADQALRDGEDYELLFTIPQESQIELETTWKKYFPDLQLTQIGHLTEKTPAEITAKPEIDIDAKKTEAPEINQLEGGWDHFQKDQNT